MTTSEMTRQERIDEARQIGFDAAVAEYETLCTYWEAYEFAAGRLEGREITVEAKSLLRSLGYDGTRDMEETVREAIRDLPASVSVRSSWYDPGDENPEPSEFKIELAGGGPAVQIRGELGENCQPYRAWLEYSNWNTPWTQLINDADGDQISTGILKWFSEFFYLGGDY